MIQISPPINSGEFEAGMRTLGHSSFNPEWLKELGVENPIIILDIGGYDAGDAIRFKKLFPQAVVLCFEADPVRAQIIGKYYDQYDIVFIPYALWCAGVNEIPFYPSICMSKDAGTTHAPGMEGGQGSAFRHAETYKNTYPHIIQKEQAIRIKATNLEAFCKDVDLPRVDLAHIDVEGAELEVIRGFGAMRPQIVYIETLEGMFEGGGSKEQIHDLLSEMGYVLAGDFVSDRLYVQAR